MKRIAFITLLALPAAIAEPVSNEEALALAGSVHVIFDRKCNECHGSQLKKPEGKFGYVLDLQRMADNLEYVVRGKPAKSELYRLVKSEEMPPDDHPKTPPLTAAEKDTVRRWILAGAPSTLPAILPKLPNAPVAREATAAKPSNGSAKDIAKQTTITLEVKDQPAGEVFALIAKQSGITVDYATPAREPRLSIALKKGTAFEALEYLALCGNFSLRFQADRAIVGPNPPPEPKPASPGPAK
jgi:hypothetical protein